VLAPTLAAVLLGGVQVADANSAAEDYRRADVLARFSDRVAALTHELAVERDRVAWHTAIESPGEGLGVVEQQMLKVDQAVTQVRQQARALGHLDERSASEIRAMLASLDTLVTLRRQAMGGELGTEALIRQYSLVIEPLLTVHDEIGRGVADDELASRSLALAALARAKESTARQRGLLTVILVSDQVDQKLLQGFLGAISREQDELRAFSAEADPREWLFYQENVPTSLSEHAHGLREAVLAKAGAGEPLSGTELARTTDVTEWFASMTAVVDRTREVEQRQQRAILARTKTLIDAEESNVILVSTMVVGLILAVLLITTGMARTLVQPLRQLRSEALDIAERRLPAIVRRLRESPDAADSIHVEPIGVLSRDEIGQVARAFDEVHREAVRLAGDEAKLRGDVNAMFVSLSRRDQTLAERQLALVERLERGERDEQRLADLQELNHLVTRMRRNSDNLLVLAGHDTDRRRGRPMELLEVIRAAKAQVEGADRVVTQVRADVAVTGQAVHDVIHLLAELLENAIMFSPSGSKVLVSSNRADGGGLMLSVIDQGIGMTAEEIDQMNERLSDPAAVDSSVSRRMGLYVVARLARRHGIRVKLGRQNVGGLTVMVLLPQSLVVPVSSADLVEPPRMPVAAAPLSAPVAPPAPLDPAGYDPGRRGPAPHEPDFYDPLPPPPRESSASGAPAEGVASVGTFQADAARPAASPAVPADGAGSPPRVPEQPPSRPGKPRARPVPDQDDEYLPIYAEMESLWFRTHSPDEAAPGKEKRTDRPAWTSPADVGWRAAEAATRNPVQDGFTAAGLPRRPPKANLVPGSAPPFRIPEIPDPGPVEPRSRPLSPERMRSRMRGLQQGVRRGRTEVAGKGRGFGGLPGGAMGGPGGRPKGPAGVWESLREQRP